MTDADGKLHLFDLKTPLGGLLTFYGIVLFVYGLTGDPSMNDRSLGHNINLWWGLLMFAGGCATLWRGMKGKKN